MNFDQKFLIQSNNFLLKYDTCAQVREESVGIETVLARKPNLRASMRGKCKDRDHTCAQTESASKYERKVWESRLYLRAN